MSKIDLLADAEAAPETLNEDATRRAARLVDELIKLQRQIYDTEETLKLLKGKAGEIETRSLPDAMVELNLRKLPLADGRTVELRDIVAAGVSKDKQSEAFVYLEARGAGPLIKTDVSMQFGRGEADKAERLCAYIAEEFGWQATPKASIHPQTLAAWVREQLAAGVDLDFALLGIYTGKKAVIK